MKRVCIFCKKQDQELDQCLCLECWTKQNGIRQCARCGDMVKRAVVIAPELGYCTRCACELIVQLQQQSDTWKNRHTKLQNRFEDVKSQLRELKMKNK